MRIIFINDTVGTGSIGRLTKELAESLEMKGHECLFAYSHGESSFHNSYRIGDEQDHNIHALMSRITGMQGYFSRRATKKLIRVIDEYKPDVIQLCNLHSNYICQPLLYRYLSKKDIAAVLVLHDCWFFTGKCTYPVMTRCGKWQDRCGRCPQLHKDNVNKSFFFDTSHRCLKDKRRWYRSISRIRAIGVSNWTTEEARKSILSIANPVAIYNWVDRDIFKPKSSDFRSKYGIEDNFMILMVANIISHKKGYKELLEIAEYADKDTAVVIVGRNKSNLPIPSNVIHIEHTDSADKLSEIYSAADVCVNTTKYETFGMVTAEAMCCGTPVIVYDNTASPELVGENCGVVVSEMDGISGIISAIEEVRERGKESYAKSCISFAEMNFERNHLVGKYERVYCELLEKKNNGNEI